MLKKLAIAFMVLSISACSSIQESVDNYNMERTLGKSYEEISAEKVLMVDASLTRPFVYGEKFAEQELANGSYIKKHLKKENHASVSVIPLLEEQKYRFIAYYFKVNKNGTIDEVASTSYETSSKMCVNFFVTVCDDTKDSTDLLKMENELDTLVRTTDGLTIEKWKSNI